MSVSGSRWQRHIPPLATFLFIIQCTMAAYTTTPRTQHMCGLAVLGAFRRWTSAMRRLPLAALFPLASAQPRATAVYTLAAMSREALCASVCRGGAPERKQHEDPPHIRVDTSHKKLFEYGSQHEHTILQRSTRPFPAPPPSTLFLILDDTGQVCDPDLPPQRQDGLGRDLLGYSQRELGADPQCHIRPQHYPPGKPVPLTEVSWHIMRIDFTSRGTPPV